MFEFVISYHPRTKRWSCNTYLNGRHQELVNFDTTEQLSKYMLRVVPPEAR